MERHAGPADHWPMPARRETARFAPTDDGGQTMVEYAVALGAVAIVTVVAFTTLGAQIGDAIGIIGNRL